MKNSQYQDLDWKIPVLIGLLQLFRELLEIMIPIEVSIITEFSPLFVIVGGPIVEEILFRLTPLGLFGRGNRYPNVIPNQPKTAMQDRLIQTIFVLVSSIAFAIYHTLVYGNVSFYYYLVGGIIYGVLFYRYGFLVSLGWHMLNNFTSVLEEAIFAFIPPLNSLILITMYVLLVESRNATISGYIYRINKQKRMLQLFWMVFFFLSVLIVPEAYSLVAIAILFFLAHIESMKIVPRSRNYLKRFRKNRKRSISDD